MLQLQQTQQRDEYDSVIRGLQAKIEETRTSLQSELDKTLLDLQKERANTAKVEEEKKFINIEG